MEKQIENCCGKLWMLHRVAPNRPEIEFHRFDKSTRITPEYLERCILEAKAAGFRFVSIDEFLANKQAGKAFAKDIVITIDDGYRDIYQYAWPVFEKHKVPFVFYVASDFILYGFDRCRRPEIDGGQLAMDYIYHHQNLAFGGKKYPARDEAEKSLCFNDLWKRYKRTKLFLPWVSGRRLLSKYLRDDSLPFDAYFKKYVCSPEELREMNASPLCTIGSHGKSHYPLYKIRLKSNLKKEFAESKRVLEGILGQVVEHFSYAYGSYCPQVDGLVRHFYKSGVAVRDACCYLSDDDYQLPRITVKAEKSPMTYIDLKD